MDRYGNTRWLAVGGLILSLAAVPSAADSDHDRARRAVEAGLILPLSRALAKIEGMYEGHVLEVELEDEDEDDDDARGSPWVYEIKLLTPQGNVLEVELDATTLDVLEVKGRGAEAARRR